MERELIKVKNVRYSEYEELLLIRDGIRKEARQYERAYIREFGDLIISVFKKK